MTLKIRLAGISRLTAALVTAAAAALGVGAVAVDHAPAASAATTPAYFPTHLTHLGTAKQAIVVTSTSWSTSYATLRTYEKGRDGVWRQKFGPMAARIGTKGFALASARRQGSLTTPAGTFTITRAFGAYANPGTKLAYTKFDKNDYWVYDPRDPSTYNVYETSRSAKAIWRTADAERLADWGTRQYRYAAVINFNMPSGVMRSASKGQYVATHAANTSRGGGIFLHVNGFGSTAGCVSVSYDNEKALLRWMDPTKGVRIVMGPQSVITRM